MCNGGLGLAHCCSHNGWLANYRASEVTELAVHDSAHLQYAEREVREYSAGPEALNGGIEFSVLSLELEMFKFLLFFFSPLSTSHTRWLRRYLKTFLTSADKDYAILSKSSFCSAVSEKLCLYATNLQRQICLLG